MSRSEFRWSKKRKHYAYLFSNKGLKVRNLLLSSKPIVFRKKHGKTKVYKNVPLFRHPNKERKGHFYVIVFIYLDELSAFDEHIYVNWNFDKNDKRIIKRIKKGKIK